MLEDIFNKLEPEVSAAVRKEKNEDYCSMHLLSNDTLGHIFGYVGEKNYLFVACVSNRFHQVYVETFGVETLTSIGKIAVLSVSCAKLCLDSTNRLDRLDRLDRSPYATALFKRAAWYGKLEVLKWGQESGYELHTVLFDMHVIGMAAKNGHLEVVRYLRKLGSPWNHWTCSNAAGNGHLKVLTWVRANGCP